MSKYFPKWTKNYLHAKIFPKMTKNYWHAKILPKKLTENRWNGKIFSGKHFYENYFTRFMIYPNMFSLSCCLSLHLPFPQILQCFSRCCSIQLYIASKHLKGRHSLGFFFSRSREKIVKIVSRQKRLPLWAETILNYLLWLLLTLSLLQLRIKLLLHEQESLNNLEFLNIQIKQLSIILKLQRE